RRVTFEYSLIAGVNDTDEDVKGLAALAGGKRNAHVNLIPVNPVTEAGLKEPDRAAVLKFRERLTGMKVNATIRRELGRDIDGACGQLRRNDNKIM
ncbi:MAG: 23S rRNA (adenine(2503)-C(2))-methyltransferase RlmN, partial [Lachnospiraceae bacterium]|nr:23S rRNA (adenine(2503)-C(2))-methyltransferase RlmN [Lachnospiraceae bacterium]